MRSNLPEVVSESDRQTFQDLLDLLQENEGTETIGKSLFETSF